MQGNKPVKKTGEAVEKTFVPKKKKVKKKRYIFLKILIFIVVCMIIFMGSAVYSYKYILEGTRQAESSIPEGEGQIFNVPYRSSTLDIAEKLMEEGYIKNTFVYRMISKVMGFDNVYTAGNFILTRNMNYYALMLALSGEPLKNPTKDIMIPEGKTLVETAQILGEQGYVDAKRFLALCENMQNQYRFLDELAVSPERKYPLEGYLYPDTYKMDEGWTEEQLIERMLKEFDRNFPQEYHDRANELGLTIDEVITIASLIEMEALYPTDLKKISSVFHNRLKSNDLKRLQSDATIQYARIYEGIGRTTSVLNKDLEIDNPYNTYKYEGLPPGPICSPRRDSIEAALYPENTEYYYFFATPDGTNIYNKTHDGHISDQQKYGVSGG